MMTSEFPWPMEKQRRSRVDWHAFLPERWATQQIAWERHRTACALRKMGLTYKEIGARFGCGAHNARLLCFKGQRQRKKQPVMDRAAYTGADKPVDRKTAMKFLRSLSVFSQAVAFARTGMVRDIIKC